MSIKTWRAFAPKSNGGLATAAPCACPDAPSDRTTRLAIRVANVSHAFMVRRLGILTSGVPPKLTQEIADPFARFEDLFDTAQIGAGIGAVHGAVVETMSEYADRANFNPLALVVRYHPWPAVHAVGR